MFNVDQQWRYTSKSHDAGLCGCTVGNTYTLFSVVFNEIAFLDDGGWMVFVDGREEEFLQHFELVTGMGKAETFKNDTVGKDAIFQQVAKGLYTVDVDTHKEFSPGSKISQVMLDYYLMLHPHNVKINVLTKFANN